MRSSITTAALLLATLSFAAPARAQGFYWSLTYEPSVPIGSLRSASTHVSPAGAALGARYLFSKNWSLGLSAHWNQFAQNYKRTTYILDEGAITGAVYRRVWAVSPLAEAHVYLGPDAPINPYLGLGAGVTWMSNLIMVSDLTFDEGALGVTLSPEAGILIAFDRLREPPRFAMQSVVIGVRYTFSTAKARDVTNTSFLGLALGLLVY